MDKISLLEAKKMLKELEYLRSDLEYKNEIVSEADGDFMRNVSEFLNGNPELKAAYDESVTRRLETSIKSKSVEVVDNLGESIPSQSQKMKRLFREIAKRTHPDKVSDSRMNEVYVDANKSYSKNDILEIFTICDGIGIEYEVDADDLALLRSEIDGIRGKILFLESTATWAWRASSDEDFKRDLVIRHISAQIR